MSTALRGKIAIVTGPWSGIGQASPERLLREGARVVIADVDQERGTAVVARFRPERGLADQYFSG
jgi:NAD(P)-dependent dehydrogenase (short-subunit alcohol dehydrogenase family)